MFSLRNALFCAMAVPISMFWVDNLWYLYWRDCEGKAHSVYLYPHYCIYFHLPRQVSGMHRRVANHGHLIRNHQMECAMNALGFFSSLLPEASFGLRVLSLPACVRVSVNHELVSAITRHNFELESPNLDQKMQNILLKVPIVLLLLLSIIPKKCQHVDNNGNH